MISQLHKSPEGGTKDFSKEVIKFGWKAKLKNWMKDGLKS
jgi:hypothetical protein